MDKIYQDASRAQYRLIEKWYKAKSAAEDAQKALEQATADLMGEMDDAGIVHLKAGVYTVTRVADAVSTSYDYKKLDAENPGLRAKYAIKTPRKGYLKK